MDKEYIKLKDINFVTPSIFGSNVKETIIDFCNRINCNQWPVCLNPKNNNTGNVFYLTSSDNHSDPILIIINMKGDVIDATTIHSFCYYNFKEKFENITNNELIKLLECGKFKN